MFRSPAPLYRRMNTHSCTLKRDYKVIDSLCPFSSCHSTSPSTIHYKIHISMSVCRSSNSSSVNPLSPCVSPNKPIPLFNVLSSYHPTPFLTTPHPSLTSPPPPLPVLLNLISKNPQYIYKCLYDLPCINISYQIHVHAVLLIKFSSSNHVSFVPNNYYNSHCFNQHIIR